MGYGKKNSNPIIVDISEAVSTQLAEKPSKADFLSYQTIPYNPMPPKQGLKTSNPKIVRKTDNNEFVVIQKTNKGYLLYTLNTKNGDTGVTSVGVNWDLIRLKKVEYSSLSYVWWDANPTIGTFASTFSAAGINTSQEQGYFGSALTSGSAISDDGTGNGFSVKTLGASSSVTFTIESSYEALTNILFMGSSGSSNSVDILVNGVVVKNFNPQSYRLPDQGNYAVLNFDLPRANFSTEKNLTVEIRNNDATRVFYFCCFNFNELKNYNGGRVNKFKAFQSGKHFINGAGANDYAIYDSDLGKWVGSFHGGETSEYAKVPWKNLVDGYEETQTLTDVATVPLSSWCVLNEFHLMQKTNLNNKGNMTSVFDFSTDGSMEMKFGLSNCTINTVNFYTALTCTHKDFLHVVFPEIASITTNANNYFRQAMGEITQRNSAELLDLNIRYTTFNRYRGDSRINPYVTQNVDYSKFYYGVVAGDASPINIQSLTFAKGLDFSVRK
ncbi:hypothetical protein [Metabacillus sp. cB07]|uniref:hypothetical protein n=1 Tax=Metabacillus sp. cB07 TaxID=2806989 RepID=UPI00193ABED7|nr:hypothetical protein [Metabacillus sp. cB07]